MPLNVRAGTASNLRQFRHTEDKSPDFVREAAKTDGDTVGKGFMDERKTFDKQRTQLALLQSTNCALSEIGAP